MRIGRKTPAYDSAETHSDQMRTFSDGTFTDFGGQSINRWDYRITNVIVSKYPRMMVSIAGRCISGPKRNPEFLSIRIGALTPKYVPLSLDSTAFVHIDSKGVLKVEHRKVSEETFRKQWETAMKGRQDTSALIVGPDILSIAEVAEQVAKGAGERRSAP